MFTWGLLFRPADDDAQLRVVSDAAWWQQHRLQHHQHHRGHHPASWFYRSVGEFVAVVLLSYLISSHLSSHLVTSYLCLSSHPWKDVSRYFSPSLISLLSSCHCLSSHLILHYLLSRLVSSSLVSCFVLTFVLLCLVLCFVFDFCLAVSCLVSCFVLTIVLLCLVLSRASFWLLLCLVLSHASFWLLSCCVLSHLVLRFDFFLVLCFILTFVLLCLVLSCLMLHFDFCLAVPCLVLLCLVSCWDKLLREPCLAMCFFRTWQPTSRCGCTHPTLPASTPTSSSCSAWPLSVRWPAPTCLQQLTITKSMSGGGPQFWLNFKQSIFLYIFLVCFFLVWAYQLLETRQNVRVCEELCTAWI